jgi:hypothetical protein
MIGWLGSTVRLFAGGRVRKGDPNVRVGRGSSMGSTEDGE